MSFSSVERLDVGTKVAGAEPGIVGPCIQDFGSALLHKSLKVDGRLPEIAAGAGGQDPSLP